MKYPSIFLAAAAATLLSTATVFAAPPSADQVTVSSGHQGRYEAKMHALFASPELRMMFKMQMRQATRGMSRDQKQAYRKDQMQKIRAMNESEKAVWRHDLQAKWDALPNERRTQIAAKMERHAERHQERKQNGGQKRNHGEDQGGQDDMGAPQQQ
jgi:hypothetical protein